MSKAKNKPKPSYETCLIVNFGLHFLKLADDVGNDELFKAFVSAYPVIGNYSNKRFGLNSHAFTEKSDPDSQNARFWLRSSKELVLSKKYAAMLEAEVKPYKADSAVTDYLRETLRMLKRMVYSATVIVTPVDNDELSGWIMKYAPVYRFEKSFWGYPGNTRIYGNPVYYWRNNKEISDKDAKMLDIFGVFRAKFIEILGKSLDTMDSNRIVFPRNKLCMGIELVKNNEIQTGRKWSNGEFYFAACKCCGAVFKKERDFDKQFCSSKKCVDRYASKMARKFRALSEACEQKNLDKISKILSDRQFVFEQDRNGLNPLMVIVKNFGELPALQLCLNKNVSVRTRDFHGETALTYAISNNLPIKAFRLLVRSIPRFDHRFMANLLFNAAQNYPDAISVIITWSKKKCTRSKDSTGFKKMIDFRDAEGDTALIKLCKNSGNPKMLKRLLSLGADPSKKNKDGKTAYHYAKSKTVLRGNSLIETLRKGQYPKTTV
ncbi:MAG: hypothetical protein GQF41_0801 [Candidatus Rifleibacterium amylolyticum]|nr:MAG: hypothetical protein GQF41_0801 [Candidatus Rifleibacterium amylolyticum]